MEAPLALALWGNWRLFAGLVVVGCAVWLVCGLDYDRTVDRTTDDDYYWLYPRLNKSISVVKQTASVLFFSLLLAAAALAAWNEWAPRFGLPREPEIPSGAWGITVPPPGHSYWRAVGLMALFVTAFKAKRVLTTPRYDAFISYRSTDAHLVRQVADRLIASRGRVWFAEYEVLISGREKFQEAIDAGVSRSARLVAFTGDAYAASAHCRGELAKFLSRARPRRVVEVRLHGGAQTHRHFPRLAESDSTTETERDPILDFLRQSCDWPVDPPAGEGAGGGASHFEGVCLGRRFRIDTTGWEQHGEGRGGEVAGGNYESPTFRRRLAGGRTVFVNLVWGPEASEEARRRHLPEADDREMYDALLEYVGRLHLERVGGRVRGVHLLFHGRLSQMCVTYWTSGYWTRKTSIVLPNPAPGEMPAEFVFTFGFDGPFTEYCRHAHLMDRLALSLDWR